MLFAIKPICGKDILQTGCSTIYIQYCFSKQKRILLHTGIAIPPEFWDRKKLRISNDIPGRFGDASEVNESLFIMIRNVEDLLIFAKKEKLIIRSHF